MHLQGSTVRCSYFNVTAKTYEVISDPRESESFLYSSNVYSWLNIFNHNCNPNSSKLRVSPLFHKPLTSDIPVVDAQKTVVQC